MANNTLLATWEEAIEGAIRRYEKDDNPSGLSMAREALRKSIHMYGMCEYHRGYQDGRRGLEPNHVNGHRFPEGGRMTYDGRLKYLVDEIPEVIEVEGRLYKLVDRPTGYVTPEDGMSKVTR